MIQLRVPRLELPTVAARVNALWDPQTAPHHMVFGKIRSGKAHLIARGLLPLCTSDRVLIIDAKGDDPCLGRLRAPGAGNPG